MLFRHWMGLESISSRNKRSQNSVRIVMVGDVRYTPEWSNFRRMAQRSIK
jgi:hypothetical protein